MTGPIVFFLDRYNRQARLAPTLVLLLPLAVVFQAWMPDEWVTAGLLAALLGTLGGTPWLVQLSRDRGKRLETSLFSKWGGKPTTRLLRHADNAIDANTKRRYHTMLGGAISGLRLPTESEECADPAAADSAYQSAVDWLLVRTRDRQAFSLVHDENISYGFRRNLFALRPVALGIGSVALLIAIVDLAATLYFGQLPDPWRFVATGTVATYVLIFAFLINERWVRVAADAYAMQLLSCCDAQNPSILPPTVVQTPKRARA